MSTTNSTTTTTCTAWMAKAIRDTFTAEVAEVLIDGGVPADWTPEDQMALDTAIRQADRFEIFRYQTDSGSGELTAGSIQAAYDSLRAKITPAMISEGATLWVEDEAGNRITMGIDRD